MNKKQLFAQESKLGAIYYW